MVASVAVPVVVVVVVVAVVAAAIALAAVAVQAAVAAVVALVVAVAATAVKPRASLSPSPQRSKRNNAVLLREQQGVNWSLASCSSPVKYMSRWSGTPPTTRVTQVPQMPCPQDIGTSMPAASNTCNTV